MPTITATIDASAARDRVWDAVVSCGRLPALAGHILSVSPAGGGTTYWRVLLNGSEVRWVQRETAAPPDELRFEQMSGDFEDLRGAWRLSDRPGGVRLTLELAFLLGIEGLAALLEPTWSQGFQAYADALVRGVVDAAEAHKVPREVPSP